MCRVSCAVSPLLYVINNLIIYTLYIQHMFSSIVFILIYDINKTYCSELWSFSLDAWMDSHREPSMIYPASRRGSEYLKKYFL